MPRSHIRRLIVVPPPRHLISIACPAWCLGHDLSAQIICVIYAQTLPTNSRAIAGALSPATGTGGCPRRGCRRSARRCPNSTTTQGSRTATSIGKVLTGHGAFSQALAFRQISVRRNPRRRGDLALRFVGDSPLEEAVRSELVSETQFPC